MSNEKSCGTNAFNQIRAYLEACETWEYEIVDGLVSQLTKLQKAVELYSADPSEYTQQLALRALFEVNTTIDKEYAL